MFFGIVRITWSKYFFHNDTFAYFTRPNVNAYNQLHVIHCSPFSLLTHDSPLNTCTSPFYCCRLWSISLNGSAMISHLAKVPYFSPTESAVISVMSSGFSVVLLKRYICFAASYKWLANNDNLIDETRAGKCSDFTRPDLISFIRAKLGHGVRVNKQNASGRQ